MARYRLEISIKEEGQYSPWELLLETNDKHEAAEILSYRQSSEPHKVQAMDTKTGEVVRAVGWLDEDRTYTIIERVYATRIDCIDMPGRAWLSNYLSNRRTRWQLA